MGWESDLAYRLRVSASANMPKWKTDISRDKVFDADARAKTFIAMWEEVKKQANRLGRSGANYPALLPWVTYDVESAAGTSPLFQRANNMFGMQKNSRPFFDTTTGGEYGAGTNAAYKNVWLAMADFLGYLDQFRIDNSSLQASLRGMERNGYWMASDGYQARINAANRAPLALGGTVFDAGGAPQPGIDGRVVVETPRTNSASLGTYILPGIAIFFIVKLLKNGKQG